MTPITLPRATVEQALEAMRRAVPTGKITLYEWDRAISDLAAALAQQAEPVQEQVPAAWQYKDTARICANTDGRMTAPPGWVPLYRKEQEA